MPNNWYLLAIFLFFLAFFRSHLSFLTERPYLWLLFYAPFILLHPTLKFANLQIRNGSLPTGSNPTLTGLRRATKHDLTPVGQGSSQVSPCPREPERSGTQDKRKCKVTLFTCSGTQEPQSLSCGQPSAELTANTRGDGHGINKYH